MRPHYHALLFGVDFRLDPKSYIVRREPHMLYSSPELEAIWQKGFCTVGDVTFQSAGYLAKYILKAGSPKENVVYLDKETGEVFELPPPFQIMSRNRGIGHGWIEKWKSDVYPSDECVVNGIRFPVPKYYDSQLSESEKAALKAQRRQAQAGREAYTPTRLEARELIMKQKNNDRSAV